MFKFEILYGFPHLVNLFTKILFLSWSCFGFLSLETDAQRFAALRSVRKFSNEHSNIEKILF